MTNYKKLKLKIKEVYDTQKAFAEALKMPLASLNQRLNNAVEWKVTEIVRVCELLNIPLTDVHIYFFCSQV